MKTVLITGAASGIGAHLMQTYAHDPVYQVLAMDVREIRAPAGVGCLQVDLCDEQAVKQAFATIERLDVAVNCAGVSSLRKPMLSFSTDDIVLGWQENFLPAFHAMQNEIAIMQRVGAGSIINIASISGHIGMKNFLAYGTAKAAIINMTKVAAIEHAAEGIRVNSISPATIDTPMIRKKLNGELRDYSQVYYTGHCGTVHDVFQVVKMLEGNAFMTGTDIKLDGGMTDLCVI